MNEYIFYTTEGQTTAPFEGIEIENCQVIGRANGSTKKEALSKLLKENAWITEAGFNPSEFIVKQIVTDELRDDLRTITDYLLKNENKLYGECEDKSNQIFDIIKRLKMAVGYIA